MLRHGLGVGRRADHHGDAVFRRRLHIHIVDAHARADDDAQVGAGFNGLAVDLADAQYETIGLLEQR